MRIIAITGPSGSGKTTLGNRISCENRIVVPKHCTTRKPRNDDKQGFYRYLTHLEYANCYIENEFFISSGDSKIIKEENGNFYGILNQDIVPVIEREKTVLIYISYKDVVDLLKKQDYQIDILHLTFQDIEIGVRSRLEKDFSRFITDEEIDKRISTAMYYETKILPTIQALLKNTIYTDKLNVDDTYKEAIKILKLER